MDGQKVFPFRANLAGGDAGGRLSQRVGWLTPYEVETLFADAMWAGRGAQLDLAVPAKTSDAGVAWISTRFERLRKRGIGVRVHRDDAWDLQEPRRLRTRGF